MSSPSKQASSKTATSSRSPSPTSGPAPATTPTIRATTPTTRATTPTTRASTSTARATTSTAAAAVSYPALYMVFWDSVQRFSNADAGKYHLGFVYVDSAPPNKGGNDATWLHITYEDSTETRSGKKWGFKPQSDMKRRSGRMRAACYLGKVETDLDALKKQLDTGIKLEQDQTDYRCRHWTLDSLELLIKGGYIEAPPLTPNELYITLLTKLEEAIKRSSKKSVSTNQKADTEGSPSTSTATDQKGETEGKPINIPFVTINQRGEVMKKSGLFRD